MWSFDKLSAYIILFHPITLGGGTVILILSLLLINEERVA